MEQPCWVGRRQEAGHPCRGPGEGMAEAAAAAVGRGRVLQGEGLLEVGGRRHMPAGAGAAPALGAA